MSISAAKILLSISEDSLDKINEQHANLVFEYKKKWLFRLINPLMLALKQKHLGRLGQAEMELGLISKDDFPIPSPTSDLQFTRDWLEKRESLLMMNVSKSLYYYEIHLFIESYLRDFSVWSKHLEKGSENFTDSDPNEKFINERLKLWDKVKEL